MLEQFLSIFYLIFRLRGHSQTTSTRFLPIIDNNDILLYCYKSLCTIDIGSTNKLPRLVNIVKECRPNLSIHQLKSAEKLIKQILCKTLLELSRWTIWMNDWHHCWSTLFVNPGVALIKDSYRSCSCPCLINKEIGNVYLVLLYVQIGLDRSKMFWTRLNTTFYY